MVITSSIMVFANGTYFVNKNVISFLAGFQQIQYRNGSSLQMTKSSSPTSYQVDLIALNHNTIRLGLIFVQIYSALVVYREFTMFNYEGYNSNSVLPWDQIGQIGITMFQGFYYCIDYVQTTGSPFEYRISITAVGKALRINFYNPFNFNNFNYNFLFVNRTLLAQYQFVENKFFTRSQSVVAALNNYQHTIVSLFYFKFTYKNAPTYDWKIDTAGPSITFSTHSSLTLITYAVNIILASQTTCYPQFYILASKICALACPSATYLNNNYCIACPQPNCQVCTASFCITCSNSSYLHNSKCKCFAGYFQLQQYCQPCPSRCRICSSYTICLSCQSGAAFRSGSCQLKDVVRYTAIYDSYDGRIEICSDQRLLERLKSSISFSCFGCKVRQESIKSDLKCVYYQAQANLAVQLFVVLAPAFQTEQFIAGALNQSVYARFPVVVTSPVFQCQQLPLSPQNLTCTVSATGFGVQLNSGLSRLFVDGAQKQADYKLRLDYATITTGIEKSSQNESEVELRLEEGGLTFDPPSMLPNRSLRTTLRVVLYSRAQKQLSKSVSAVSSYFFRAISLVLTGLNLLGLLKGVQIIFSTTTFLIVISPFYSQVPLSFKAAYSFLLKLQSVLLPDQLFQVLSQTFTSPSIIWLCVFFSPIAASSIMTILLKLVLTLFKCLRRNKALSKFKPLGSRLRAVIKDYQKVSSGFSYGTLKIVTVSGIASPLLVVVGGCWLFLIFFLFIRSWKFSKYKFRISSLAQLVLTASSFLTGVLSLVSRNMTLFAALMLLLNVLQLIAINQVGLKKNLTKTINCCGEFLMCLWLLVNNLEESFGLSMGIALLCTLSILILINISRAVKSLFYCCKKLLDNDNNKIKRYWVRIRNRRQRRLHNFQKIKIVVKGVL